MEKGIFEKFSENIKALRNKEGLSQKELGIKMGKSEESAQPYVAKLENNKKPNTDDLIILSKLFDTSIDELLGLKHSKNNDALTPRDICRFLLKCKHVNLTMTTHTTKENCFYMTHHETTENNFDIIQHKQENKYISIFFSNWDTADTQADTFEFLHSGNDNYKSMAINKFLERYKQIQIMKKNGNLDDEMFNRLLESYINDVPDN